MFDAVDLQNHEVLATVFQKELQHIIPYVSFTSEISVIHEPDIGE